MMTNAGSTAGFEWGGGDNANPIKRDDRGWPILRPSDPDPCDGANPLTGLPCRLGHHSGYHRDDSGAEWLDEGDMAKPDWLNG